MVNWAYGICTVEERLETSFPKTLESLKRGGFTEPRLFVDGVKPSDLKPYLELGLQVTSRYPKVRVAFNWHLSMLELYMREPKADFYALFQDDILCCKNLKAYLEKVRYPDNGYWNLITYPSNQLWDLTPLDSPKGFYLSNQLGKGAQGLVFNRLALLRLFTSSHLIERPMDLEKGWRSIDGGVSTSMKKAGWKEYVHKPSLLTHTGDTNGVPSTFNNNRQPAIVGFPGEEFDVLSLFDTKSES